jgi:hypothetical protein
MGFSPDSSRSGAVSNFPAYHRSEALGWGSESEARQLQTPEGQGAASNNSQETTGTMSIESPYFLWLPLIAVVLHLIEEFVFPGGFAAWYRRYKPDVADSITTPFLVIINAVFVVLALMPILLGHTPRGYAFWSVVVAIGMANAVFHIWAVIKTDEYSPGFVTGLLIYIPLFLLGVWALRDYHKIAVGTIAEAVAIGVLFHVWSEWNHRRRARRLASPSVGA